MIPHPTILTAVQVAAARGVRVRIHTNGPEAEHALLYHAQRSYYRVFLEAGVSISETARDYCHAKLVVVDGEQVFVGSPNLDVRSTELNFEVGVLVSSADLSAGATALLERWRQAGTPVRVEDLRADRYNTIVQGFCRLLSPIL
jgi:cardiolipin synthase